MNRKENAKNLGDKRFMSEAKQLSNMPGGPHNTSPVNMNSYGAASTPSVGGMSIYLDHNQNGAYAQNDPSFLDPNKYTPSGTSNFPIGIGNNAGVYYGKQEQPSPNAEEVMEGMRQAGDASNRGLLANSYLGMTGSEALIPGSIPGGTPGQGRPLMQPMVTMDGPQGNNANAKGKA